MGNEPKDWKLWGIGDVVGLQRVEKAAGRDGYPTQPWLTRSRQGRDVALPVSNILEDLEMSVN